MDQDRFNNQHTDFVSASQAAQYLNIKRSTLYSYVSRGLIKSVPGKGGHRYLFADLERVKARHDARSGHAPVAAAALRWGEPVLASSLTRIDQFGPSYRGFYAIELVEQGISFEAVAEFLWGEGKSPLRSHSGWSFAKSVLDNMSKPYMAFSKNPQNANTFSSLIFDLSFLATQKTFFGTLSVEKERQHAQALMMHLAALFYKQNNVKKPFFGQSKLADMLAISFGKPPVSNISRAIEDALILCADHELNPSTFTARVTASAGADLYACLIAALATLSGVHHGGICHQLETLLHSLQTKQQVGAVLGRHHKTLVPGFFHPLYPKGDPRGRYLLESATRFRKGSKPFEMLLLLCEKLSAKQQVYPTLDTGLVALSMALDLPQGAATTLFAFGRFAGWVAHILEQREAGILLRPRARYLGPPPQKLSRSLEESDQRGAEG